MITLAVILRVDIDNPYGWQNFGKKTLNYLRLNWWFPAAKKLGYLKSLDELLDDLEARKIPATLFFTKFTTPKNLEPYKKHEVGAHLISARNYNEFLKELSQISKKLHRKIQGFTKHGSGKQKLCRTHTTKYEPDKYIDWAKKANLEYFLGNSENPEEKPYFAGNVLVYPSAFWIHKNYRADKHTINWLAEESKNRDIIVLLHPYNWATNKQVRKDYEKIITKVSTFKELSSSAFSV